MSKHFKIKDSNRMSSEVNLLLDSGFTPDAIIRYLKLEYDFEVNRSTIYRYRKDCYKPKPYRKVIKDKIFEECGRFIDVVEVKVAIVAIFTARIGQARKREEEIGIPLKNVDESLMKLNTVLNEFYEMYQDMGLIPIRNESISIDATLTERKEPKSSLEMSLANLSSKDKDKLIQEINQRIKKINGKEAKNGESWIQHTDKRD